MATPEEIERRVEENDTAWSAKRSAAAKRVGELAKRRAASAEQLSDIERELGDVLAESSDVIGTDELAKFTDVPCRGAQSVAQRREDHSHQTQEVHSWLVCREERHEPRIA